MSMITSNREVINRDLQSQISTIEVVELTERYVMMYQTNIKVSHSISINTLSHFKSKEQT